MGAPSRNCSTLQQCAQISQIKMLQARMGKMIVHTGFDQPNKPWAHQHKKVRLTQQISPIQAGTNMSFVHSSSNKNMRNNSECKCEINSEDSLRILWYSNMAFDKKPLDKDLQMGIFSTEGWLDLFEPHGFSLDLYTPHKRHAKCWI